jgi:hypothetical protein
MLSGGINYRDKNVKRLGSFIYRCYAPSTYGSEYRPGDLIVPLPTPVKEMIS